MLESRLKFQLTGDSSYSHIYQILQVPKCKLPSGTTIGGLTIADATASKPIFKCIDVADEANLNSTLNSIASEIKSWAGYQAAKNVE